MKKVLITDPLASAGIDVLEQGGLSVIQLLDKDTQKLEAILPEVDGWIIRSGTQIGEKELQHAKSLKAIGRAGVGVDNIDIPAATSQGIVVMNTPGGNTISAAEHTIALLMSLARNVPAGDASLKSGRWDRKTLVGSELSGKTMGILGLGRIGQEVARRALGLQMKVLGYDPFVSEEQLRVPEIEIKDLDTILKEADVLSLHLPRNKDTLNLIGEAQLEKMKTTAFIINCARGGLINEAELAQALNAGTIAGAAIDVFSSEPPEGNPLLSANNIVLTPHLGASTREAGDNVAVQVARQMVDFLVNDVLSNTLNMPVKNMSVLKQLTPTLDLARSIGKLQQALNPGPIKSFQLSYNGDPGHVQALLFTAFEGVMTNRYDGVVNLINAKSIADARKISLKSVSAPDLSHVQNVVSVKVESEKGQPWELMGYTDLQGGQRLIRVNNYRVDVLLDGPLLMVINKDVPGVVGEVGTLLGSAGINIAEFSLSRSGGTQALSLIKCDSAPDTEVMETLKQMPSIQENYFLST